MPIINPFKKYRIDHLIFWSFSTFIIFLILLVSWVSYSISSHALVRNASFYQKELLDEMSHQVDSQLLTVEQVSLSLTQGSDVLDAVSKLQDKYTRYKNQIAVGTHLQNIIYSTTIIDSITIYLPGVIYTHDMAPAHFERFSDLFHKTWYADLKKTDFAWLGSHPNPYDSQHEQLISFVRKIYSNNGEYRGLLVLNIKASDVRRLIQGRSKETNRVLINSLEEPLISTGMAIPFSDIKTYIPSASGTGYRKIRLEGAVKHDYLMVWSHIFNSKWMIIQLTPWHSITKDSVHTAETLLFIGIAAVLASLFITLLLSRQFTRPIKKLVRVMNKFSLSEQNNSNLVPNDYRNEFGILLHGYNRLIDRIGELYQNLLENFRKKKIAEIQALQAMINPHFLYNTLDQINWMAIDAGQDKISHVLELMGRMFRIGLSNGENLIPIKDEIEHIRCYLEIQQIRLGERMRFEIQVSEEFEDYYIPKLTLQPFVENAIIHGLHNRSEGFIKIVARLRREDLQFLISDNGVGMSPARNMEKKPRTKGGYGIRNVKERIETFFGEKYGLQIDSIPGEGTTVIITLPILTGNEEPGGFHVGNSNH